MFPYFLKHLLTLFMSSFCALDCGILDSVNLAFSKIIVRSMETTNLKGNAWNQNHTRKKRSNSPGILSIRLFRTSKIPLIHPALYWNIYTSRFRNCVLSKHDFRMEMNQNFHQ